METYTKEQVVNILVSMFVFANNSDKIMTIKGQNFGEKANTVINANDSIRGTGQSLVSVVAKFKE